MHVHSVYIIEHQGNVTEKDCCLPTVPRRLLGLSFAMDQTSFRCDRCVCLGRNRPDEAVLGRLVAVDRERAARGHQGECIAKDKWIAMPSSTVRDLRRAENAAALQGRPRRLPFAREPRPWLCRASSTGIAESRRRPSFSIPARLPAGRHAEVGVGIREMNAEPSSSASAARDHSQTYPAAPPTRAVRSAYAARIMSATTSHAVQRRGCQGQARP